MAYNIEYDDNAIKQLKKIDKSQRDIILNRKIIRLLYNLSSQRMKVWL